MIKKLGEKKYFFQLHQYIDIIIAPYLLHRLNNFALLGDISQHKEAYVTSYHGVLCHNYHGIPNVKMHQFQNIPYACSYNSLAACIEFLHAQQHTVTTIEVQRQTYKKVVLVSHAVVYKIESLSLKSFSKSNQ